MRIAIVTHTTPNIPSKDGLSLILFYLLKQLGEAHTISVIPLDKTSDVQAELNRAMDQQAVLYFHGLDALKHLPDVAHYPRVVAGMIDTPSLKFAELAAHESGTLAKRRFLKQQATWAVFEQTHLSKVNHIIVGTDADRNALIKEVGAKPFINVIPNGVDADYYSPTNEAEKEHHLVFCGMLEQPVHAQAVTQFIKEVWPLIKKQHSNLKWLIVGKDPSKQLVSLAKKDSSLVLTGFVPEVRDFLQHAQLFVSPLHIRSGMRNTVLEAMACALPVVAYADACGGLEASPIRKVSTPADFTQAISTLLNDESLRLQVGALSRKFVMQHHNWATQAQLYERVFSQAER